MISLISMGFGLPGSGKSLWLAYLADRASKGKKLKVGNYDLQHIPGMTYDRIYTNFSFPDAYIFDWDTLGHCNYENTLFLIDEVMMYADSRDFKTFDKYHKWFFSQARKMHVDVVITSQMYDDVDKKVRGIVENFYYIQDSWIPGFSQVRPIESFFDIKDGQIRSGQQFSRLINCSWFRRKPLYPKVNSYELIGMHPTEPPPDDRWDGLTPAEVELKQALAATV